MKIYTVYRITIIVITLCSKTITSQHVISGNIRSNETDIAIENVKIYDDKGRLLSISDQNGDYTLHTNKDTLNISYFSYNFSILDTTIFVSTNKVLDIYLSRISVILDPVEIRRKDSIIFNLVNLRDIEGTTINSARKTEVVLISQIEGNLASNNARQIYNKVSGLNIYQNDDAGLQLNIGGRGLDPKRSSNFNTRQNGYDISADVLGYPESYYTPPVEALEKIQIIRGASSLQYGSQFGGLINFIMKDPKNNKQFNVLTRNTIGSNSLYTNFTSLSGNFKDLSLYSYMNYKKGDGFRDNSTFESQNIYSYISYSKERMKISSEITYLNYLSQQAGGLTDQMFNQDPLQSNRERNWFAVNWMIYNMKCHYKINNNNNLSLSIFGLNATRDALGFRANRVSQVDPLEERDLIKGKFRNYGLESRFLHKYHLFNRRSVMLIGSKLYKSNNHSEQGPGSSNSDPDFDFYLSDSPFYSNQSSYNYPNINTSIFLENIYYLSEKISVTPGIRIEYINTRGIGNYRQINLDAANNVIFDTIINQDINKKRSFILSGIGISYKLNDDIEIYTNCSQNYRSVTFSDISIIQPSYVIDPDISDENGYTLDIGVRGRNNTLSYELTSFALRYNNRIGFIQRTFPDGNVKSERTNVGNAIIYGFESLLDINLNQLFSENKSIAFNYFLNTSIVDSKYLQSLENGVTGNKVEFVPNVNMKTGLKSGNKYISVQIQYTFLSKQFTDASNAIETNLSGIIGEIPRYNILDISSSFLYKKIRCEAGINNLLDTYYFTRRATGYPGPGIIPSPNRNFYVTLQLSL